MWNARVAQALGALCLGLLSSCRTVPGDARRQGGAVRSMPVVSTTIDFLDYCWGQTDPAVGHFT